MAPYHAISGPTRLYQALSTPTRQYQAPSSHSRLIRPYQTLLGLIRPYQSLQGHIRPYQALPGHTRPYQTLSGPTRPYWALSGPTRPYQTLYKQTDNMFGILSNDRVEMVMHLRIWCIFCSPLRTGFGFFHTTRGSKDAWKNQKPALGLPCLEFYMQTGFNIFFTFSLVPL